jgi:hypothetical protein
MTVCDRCGRALAPGSIKYNVQVRITADWDEHLPEAAAHETMASMLEVAAGKSETELDHDVDQALAFTICPKCRRALLADPLARGALQ